MGKWLFLVLAIFLVSCATQAPIVDEPVAVPEPIEVPEPVEVVEGPVEVVKEPVKAGPEVKEEEPEVDNQIPEGFLDLQNYKGTAEEILFDYLREWDKEHYDKTRTKQYMNIEKPYEGLVRIYYAKWVNVSDEFLEKEGTMIGSVWEEANAGKSQYFEAILYDYRGVIVANVIVKNSEVKVILKKSVSII